jgi:hypothetical protein
MAKAIALIALIALTSCQFNDTIGYLWNNSDSIKRFLVDGPFAKDFKNITTYAAILKGILSKELNSNCVKHIQSLTSNVVYPTNSTAPSYIKAIDTLLQFDEQFQDRTKIEYLRECSDLINQLFVNDKIIEKLIQNTDRAKHLVTGPNSKRGFQIVFNYFMKDFEKIGQAVRDSIDEIREFELKENFNYAEEFQAKERMAHLKDFVLGKLEINNGTEVNATLVGQQLIKYFMNKTNISNETLNMTEIEEVLDDPDRDAPEAANNN